MKAYAYSAALLCEPCALETVAALRLKGVADSGDSSSFPQGPYEEGGGEADTPQHCDACGAFLCNSLTRDGRAYVAERIADKPQHGIAARIWSPFYGINAALARRIIAGKES